MVGEDHIEDMEKGNCPLGKIIRSPVRDAVRANSVAKRKDPESCLNLVRVCKLWFAGRVHDVRLDRHVNYFNNSWDRINN
jgi:hypothetical protein